MPDAPDMRVLTETPPRCPKCYSLLPGIHTQQALATFVHVRCYRWHLWFSPEVPPHVATTIAEHAQRAKGRQERMWRELDQE